VAAESFGDFLTADGITVAAGPYTGTAPSGAATVSSVSSPPLAAIVEQMLLESNNVIAENLARHVAIATGHPASFAGAAAAGRGLAGLALAAPVVQIGLGRLAKDVPLANRVRSGRKQP